MSRRLDGRHALVTGAARGIGEAIVRRFVLEGARVMGRDKANEQVSPGAVELLENLAGDFADRLDRGGMARQRRCVPVHEIHCPGPSTRGGIGLSAIRPAGGP